MNLTLWEKAQMLYDLQESIWENWEQTPEYLRNSGFIRKPDERLTLTHFTVELMYRMRDQYDFDMSNVTTGARRKWRKTI